MKKKLSKWTFQKIKIWIKCYIQNSQLRYLERKLKIITPHNPHWSANEILKHYLNLPIVMKLYKEKRDFWSFSRSPKKLFISKMNQRICQKPVKLEKVHLLMSRSWTSSVLMFWVEYIVQLEPEFIKQLSLAIEPLWCKIVSPFVEWVHYRHYLPKKF